MQIDRSSVALREIDDANRAAVELLRVAPGQETYVAGVAQSFVDAVTDPEPVRGSARSTRAMNRSGS